MADDITKKRRLEDIASPEKRLERAKVAEGLIKLNGGDLCKQELSEIVKNVTDYF